MDTKKYVRKNAASIRWGQKVHMHNVHADYSNQPYAIAHSREGILAFIYSTNSLRKIRQYLIHLFMSISLIDLLVKGIRIIWQIGAFIVSFLFRQPVNKGKQPRLPEPVGAIEQKPLAKTSIQENEQERQEKLLKDNFLSMASHELKTPMTTIVGQVQLLLRRMAKLPEMPSELTIMRTALESIDGQTRRLNGLVNELLDMYNIRSGKVQLNLTRCNIVTLCRDVVEEQQQLSGRTIEFEAPLLSISLCGDTYRLQQVMVNLINNALRYSPEQSPIHVLVERNGANAVIEVSNSGLAISIEDQARIFEPFYRGADVQLSSKHGLGLGLAISKDIVDRHSGHISYHSIPDKGNIFIVEIPIKDTRNLNS